MRSSHFTHDEQDRGRRHAHGDWPPFFGPGFGRGHWGGGRGPAGFVAAGGAGAAMCQPRPRPAAERPMHGYEMIQDSTRVPGASGGRAPGSVYPTLQLLEDEGLVASTSPRAASCSPYRLRSEAAATPPSTPRGSPSPTRASPRHTTCATPPRVFNALREVGTHGSDDQRARPSRSWRTPAQALRHPRRGGLSQTRSSGRSGPPFPGLR